MNWPRSLDVVVEYSDDDKKEKAATLIRPVEHYGPFGPMAEYQTTDGEKFWVEAEYYRSCKDEVRLPRIPIEVIRKNAEIQRKLEFGQRQVNQQQKRDATGLVLPDGFSSLPN